MTEKQFTEQDSVALIRSMLERTQQGVEENGFFFLLWGWLVFVSAALNYLGWMIIGPKEWIFLPWAILMPAGGIISAIVGARKKRETRVVTYTQDLLKYVLTAYLVSMFIVLFPGMWFWGWEKTYPMLMVIYGIWLFISGGALQFRWLIAGGIFSWCCAVATFFVPSPHQLLMLALAVLCGYIIPGHLLRIRFRKQHHATV